jgi:hypothetical protein
MPGVETLVRTYTGDNQAGAAALYAEDAVRLADDGWVAVTQSWVAGEWPGAVWLVGALLVPFIVGIGILIMLAFLKPNRTLMVTYRRSREHDSAT